MKAKFKIGLTLCLTTLIILSACNKGDDPAKFEDPIVHMVGESFDGENYTTAYWKDGIKTFLPNPGEKSYSSSIVVKDRDVFISGIDNTNPQRIGVLWKNGKIEKQYSPPGNQSYLRFFLTFFGNDQYSIFKEGQLTFSYYKNEQKIKTHTGSPNSLAVNNNDVYISGYKPSEFQNIEPKATIWKNNDEITLKPGDAIGYYETHEIAFSGNDVFVAGRRKTSAAGEKDLAIIWKNGIETILPSTGDAEAFSVFVINNDVYVAGYSSETIGGTRHATYWKNGVPVVLDNSSQTTQLADIAVSKSGKVYAVGYFGNDEYGILWVDGKVDSNINGTNDEYIYYISLEEK